MTVPISSVFSHTKVLHPQVADALRRDPRLLVMERNNLRHLTAADLPARPQLVTLDLSFIRQGLDRVCCVRMLASPPPGPFHFVRRIPFNSLHQVHRHLFAWVQQCHSQI